MNSTFQIVASLTGQRNVIPVPVVYVRVFGSYEAAVMLSQLTYWHDKIEPGRGGWQYRTEKDWEEEAALGRRAIESARKALVAAGVIEYKLMGVPAKGHYRVIPDKIISILQDRVTENPDCGNRTNLIGGNVQTRLLDSANLLQEPTAEPTASSLFAQPEEKQDEERKKSVRQHHAISASMEKSAKKKLEELLGDRYKYARDLVNKHGSKAETVHSRLSSTPALLSAFLTLGDDSFAALVERATSEAAKYKSGWQQNIGWQFFDLLGKGVAAHSSGNNSVAAALVDQMEAEFPCPFDPDDFRQVGKRSDFISNRKYYFHLRETRENPEAEARLKAYLERAIRENSPERNNDESSPEHP